LAGRLTVITGPMFAGKSTELLRRVRRAKLAGIKVALLKPSIDTRFGTVRSHDGLELEAKLIGPNDPIGPMAGDAKLIAIDEMQFLADETYVSIIANMVELGRDFVLAGLDLDYAGRPFGLMPVLMAYADEVVKLSAICAKCGNDATRTQRLVNGEPAGLGPVVQIGGAESYEARCLDCWVPPSRVGLGTSE